jgi:ubiquinone/menaquinone biosynthesis C-methylase UbiE
MKIKNEFPKYFKNKSTLDCGSLDINGNNRYLFEGGTYTGVDVGVGPNVDIVSMVHALELPSNSVEFIVSTEMLEHDMHYDKSLTNMVRMLKPGCMLLFTCATTGRGEHGTRRTTPGNAPLLSGEWSDYYKNLTEADIKSIKGFIDEFSEYHFEVNNNSHDLYFYGIKR